MCLVPRLRLSLTLAAVALFLLLAGCGGSDSTSGDGRRIVASFYPLAYAAERVAGDTSVVVNLTQPGQEPHDLELGVQQTADIAGADLVVYQHGFQPAVDDSVEQNAGGPTLDVEDVIELRPVAAHDHEEESVAEEDEHEHGERDPHFWQDPLRLAELGDAIADELSEIDPARADQYATNARGFRSDLETLHQEYVDGLAECDLDVVVVNHDAFGYLEGYGLHIEPIAGLSPEAEPTASDLARIQDLVRTEDITTVFSETLVSEKTAETLADDLDIQAKVLDPIEGLSDESAGEDYLSLMRTNLATLQQANGC